jgi:hypothetical protein
MNTYSFLDCVLNLVFPGGGYVLTGKGLGDVTVSMAQERSAIEAAADGSIMISKIAGNHGSLVINIQQTSDAHKFLLAMYNALIIGPPSAWAQGAGVMRCVSDSTSHTFTGVCFQKLGDKGYEKQGKMVQWTLLCGDIQSAPF